MEPPPILGLLADPVRWHLLVELGQSDRRVGELADLTGRPQNLVSYHLGELRRAGIVSARRSSADGRDVYYRSDTETCRALLVEAGRSIRAPAVRGGRPATGPPRPRRRPRVLFVCTGNSARSQMAEALTEHHSSGAVEARSAGSHPKELHPQAVRAMGERGVDITGRSAKPLSRFARTRFDRVVTLCDRVREVCPRFPGDPVTVHWSIPDPAADPGGYPAFARVADDIERRVALLLEHLATPSRKEPSHA